MITRRSLLARLSAAMAMGTTPALQAQSFQSIPQRASSRIIVDNDFAGDPDGLIALAHQLLTPKARVVLVTSSPLDPKMTGNIPAGRSAAIGREIALELMQRCGISHPPLVLAGSEAPGEVAAPPSAAARAIVSEAMRDDDLPLFITCGGPLTNIAAALRLEPRIASRLTLIWIGGGPYPNGGLEYNLNTDLSAARTVVEHSTVPLWQVPQPAYRQMQVSIAEMTAQLPAISPFGAWLYSKFTTPPSFVNLPGSWPWGDTPTVLLSSVSSESSQYVDQAARRILPGGVYGTIIPGRTIRVFETLDVRLALADFMALMRLHASSLLVSGSPATKVRQ